MNILIICVALFILTICGTGLMIYHNISVYNRFQDTMKVGDLCFVIIKESKTPAVITAIFNNIIIVEDNEGDAHSFERKDIYPSKFLLS